MALRGNQAPGPDDEGRAGGDDGAKTDAAAKGGVGQQPISRGQSVGDGVHRADRASEYRQERDAGTKLKMIS